MTTGDFPRVDRSLSRRLERAEGHAAARFVESRARVMPGIGACWTEVDGAYAMFDGVGSPLTQTFGLGLFGSTTDATLDGIEAFFAARGADAFHEVSPLADWSTVAALNARGYRPCEFTSVLFQPLPPTAPLPLPSPALTARLAVPAEHAVWAETAIAGWGELPEVREFMASFGATAVAAEDMYPFLAFDGGVPIATGSLATHGDVALLAGASTVPSARGRGAQRALLSARLTFAAGRGCTLAMMCAAPGSSSQRNAERSGFRIAYTRIKWHRAR